MSLFLVFALAYGGLFLASSFFTIKTVELQNSQTDHPVSGISELEGTNILFLSTADAAKKIKDKNPYVKSVSISKKYPSTVQVAVGYYAEEAELNVGTGYFMLSSDGRILAKNKTGPEGRPLINFYQKLNYYSYSSGDYLNINDINDSIYYINLLESLGMPVESLDIKDRDMLVCNVGSKTVTFTTSKSREQQKYELTQIVRQFKITGTDYKYIDLRFEKPIVKF